MKIIMIQETKETKKNKVHNKHSLNTNHDVPCQQFIVLFQALCFITSSAFDVNTLHKRLSDAKYFTTKKLVFCVLMISITNERLKAVNNILGNCLTNVCYVYALIYMVVNEHLELRTI